MHKDMRGIKNRNDTSSLQFWQQNQEAKMLSLYKGDPLAIHCVPRAFRNTVPSGGSYQCCTARSFHWEATDEGQNARNKLLTPAGGCREAQDMLQPGGQEQEHSPMASTAFGVRCLPTPPHGMSYSAMLSGAAARPQWNPGYQWPGQQPLGEEQRGCNALPPSMCIEWGAVLTGPLCKPMGTFSAQPQGNPISPWQELLVPRCLWDMKRAGDVWGSKWSLMDRITVYKITRMKPGKEKNCLSWRQYYPNNK